MLEKYYSRMSHLRLALPLLTDISALENLIYNFVRPRVIQQLSYTSLKYEKELQQIGFYFSGRTIVKGETSILYSHKSDDDLLDDLYYLIDCLVVIGAVRFGMEDSIESALEKIQIENTEMAFA